VPLLWFANLQKTSLVTSAYKNVLPQLQQFTQMWLKVSENETDKNQTDTAARKMKLHVVRSHLRLFASSFIYVYLQQLLESKGS